MKTLPSRLLWIAIPPIFISLFLSRCSFQENTHTEVFVRTDRLVSSERIKKELAILASKPHRAGTEANAQVGNRIIARLQKAGLDVQTDSHDFELPEPVELRLSMIAPEPREFIMHEKALGEDPYSIIAGNEMPYLAYSPDADLEADIVFANFGAPQDYEYLKKSGIDVKGKVALVRGRGICRSMKILAAENEQVAGLLIYPEVRDQGILKTAFPNGTHLNPWTAQRGSLLKYFLFPGDPLAAEKAGIKTEPSIPAIAITPETALILFNHLSGSPVPQDWQGWLTKTYRTGPGKARVRMLATSKREPRKLRNIIARIKGKSEKDAQIIAGNHYDAWVYGASDPSSGTAVLLEAAEVLGDLKKDGWMPERDLVFAFWDGEEYGMLGSTAWFLNRRQWISKTAAYVNIDTAYRANDLAAYISPGLRTAFDQSLDGVKDPLSGHYFLDIRGEYGSPGFSSDVNPFTMFSGIPAAEIGFGRSYALYHSIYDNLTWLEKFGDPGAKYRSTLAQITIRYLYLLSSDQILPYNFTEIAGFTEETLSGWEKNFKHLPAYGTQTAKLRVQVNQFNAAAKDFEASRRSLRRNFDRQNEVNELLMKIFSGFYTSESGSLLSKPSLDKGCAGEALPQIYNSFASNDRKLVESKFQELASVFLQATENIRRAEEMVKQ